MSSKKVLFIVDGVHCYYDDGTFLYSKLHLHNWKIADGLVFWWQDDVKITWIDNSRVQQAYQQYLLRLITNESNDYNAQA